MYFNVNTQKKHLLYIVSEMNFNDKTYGLSILVTHILPIELHLKDFFGVYF
jgi:hypothetical protein